MRLIAFDADVSPEDFEKSLWFPKDRKHVIAPDGWSCPSVQVEKCQRVVDL